MYNIKRASAYILSDKGKSMAIIGIFLLLLTSTFITNNFDATIKQYYQQIESSSLIPVKFVPQINGGAKGMMKMGGENEITIEQLSPLIDLDYVDSYSESSTLMINSEDIQAISVDTSDNQFATELSLKGSSALAQEQSYLDGDITLSEDNLNLAENQIIVSQKLLDENDLSIGDTLSLEAKQRGPGQDTEDSEAIIEDYQIAASYEYNGTYEDMANVPENTIYTTYESLENLKDDNNHGVISNITFYLNDINKFDEFKTQVYQELGITTEEYSLVMDDETYLKVIQPLEKIQVVLKVIQKIIIVMSLILLAFLITIMLRARKEELVVLYMLGTKKSQIILQILLETTILFVIATIIAGGLSILITKGILDSDIINSTMSNSPGQMGRMPMNTPSMPITIEMTINYLSLVIASLINLIFIYFVYIVSTIKLLGNNPHKILK